MVEFEKDNRIIKTARELAMEKAEAMEKKQEKPEKSESEAEIKNQRAETVALEIKAEETDLKKIEKLAKEMKFDLSADEDLQRKESKVDKMKEEAASLLENKKESANKDEDDDNEDRETAAAARELLKNIKRIKNGGAPAGINLEGLPEESKKDFGDSQKAQEMLHKMKKDKAEKKENEKQETGGKEEDGEGEKTKTCANCGAEGSADSNFCEKCGTKFEKEKEERKSSIVPESEVEKKARGMSISKGTYERNLARLLKEQEKRRVEKIPAVEKPKEAVEEQTTGEDKI